MHPPLGLNWPPEEVVLKAETVSKCLIAWGVVHLVLGLLGFMRLALTGQGSILVIFAFFMSALLFFNLPAVLARKRDREGGSESPETVEELGDGATEDDAS